MIWFVGLVAGFLLLSKSRLIPVSPVLQFNKRRRQLSRLANRQSLLNGASNTHLVSTGECNCVPSAVSSIPFVLAFEQYLPLALAFLSLTRKILKSRPGSYTRAPIS